MMIGKFAFPVTAAIVITILGTVYQIIITYYGGEVSRGANYLYLASFSLLVALVVELDRKQRSVSRRMGSGLLL
jgi:hypothetical protein